MSRHALKSSRIIVPNDSISGYVVINDGVIESITSTPPAADVAITDYQDQIILPGFVDIHVHGYGRGSFAYSGTVDSLRWMSEDLVRGGVTSFLATSGTMPHEFLVDSLKNANLYAKSRVRGQGADMIGVHMEGPYINPSHLGMQRKDAVRSPSIQDFDDYNAHSGGQVRLMTLAPEVEGCLALIGHLDRLGITASAGHTDATFEQIKAGIQAGLKHFTHAYSGMRGFHHRELGTVGALMYFEDAYAEVAKQTGITIKPEAFELLYRLKKDRRMVMMSDCMGYFGFPEGYQFEHYLRKETFHIHHGALCIHNARDERVVVTSSDIDKIMSLEMSFIESAKNIVHKLERQFISLAQITALNPAILAGAADSKGSIEIGKDADLIVIDDAVNLMAVYCCGEKQNIF